MLELLKKNYVYYLLFLPLYSFSGLFGSIAPLAVGMLGIFWFTLKERYELIVLTFIVTLIFANSKATIFLGFDILRAVFVLFMLGFSLIIMNREGRIERRVSYFFPFLIVALLVSFLFSPRFMNSVISVLAYLFLVISVFTFVKYVIRQHQLQFYEHLIVVFVLTAIISLLGGYILFPAGFIEMGRLRGILGNPNTLALFCVMSYPFLDYYNPERGDISEWGILIGKGLLILCLFLSGSRTGYTSFIIYLLLTIFLFRGMSGRTVAVVVGLAALFTLFQLETLVNLFPALRDIIRPESIQSASGRMPAWIVAMDEISRQPWLGGGFEYSTYYMANFATAHGLIAVYWYGVWSSYLSFLMNVGIIGLAAYVFFVFGLTKTSPRIKMLIPFLGVVLFTAIFESWMISSLNAVTSLFLIFFVINSEYEGRY